MPVLVRSSSEGRGREGIRNRSLSAYRSRSVLCTCLGGSGIGVGIDGIGIGGIGIGGIGIDAGTSLFDSVSDLRNLRPDVAAKAGYHGDGNGEGDHGNRYSHHEAPTDGLRSEWNPVGNNVSDEVGDNG